MHSQPKNSQLLQREWEGVGGDAHRNNKSQSLARSSLGCPKHIPASKRHNQRGHLNFGGDHPANLGQPYRRERERESRVEHDVSFYKKPRRNPEPARVFLEIGRSENLLTPPTSI